MSVYTEVRKLDKHQCRVFGCGSRLNVEVHHIVPKGQGGPDEPWNLICLCQRHHHLVSMNKISNIDILSPLLKKTDFRWNEALEWHLNRELLKNLGK